MEATALRLTGTDSFNSLLFESIKLAEPGPNDVLVRNRAISLNQRDLMLVEGKYGPDHLMPLTLGSDGAGEVLAVGEAVTRFKVGDRVVTSFYRDWTDGLLHFKNAKATLGAGVNGTMATHYVLPEHGLVAIPDALSFEEAATLPCAGVTAWHALVSTGDVGQDDTVAVLGTGGVSIVGLQIAKLRGARVIVTSSSDEKLERAKAMGADETINYKTTPEWDRRVRELTGKAGATHVLETGGAGTLPVSLRAAGYNAQVSVIGLISGAEQPIDLRPILGKNLRVQGITVGSRQMLEEIAQAFAANGIKPVIDQRFTFDRSIEALRSLKAAEHFGKIVITVP
jgi:NADPH:quinone reductase-like Zn-dependent oxidoreductase